jgi:lipopolysaccharide transport system ATP-binding protein
MAMRQQAAIGCRNVTKRFILDTSGALWKLLRANGRAPSYQALTDVSLDVPKGEFVGLLGRNGAGKSTLLRTVGGVHTPDRGQVRVNGELAGLYELGIVGNDHLDGAGFATRWFEIIGTGDARAEDLIAEIRGFSELGEAFTRPIRTYSSGMRARLYFAVATALPADVYVIDEMLSVGDEYFQSKCWRRLRERLGNGASGLLATHDWTAILKLCPTCHVLEHGRIVASGPSPAVVKHYLGSSIDALESGAKFTDTLPERLVAQSLKPFLATVEIDVAILGDVQFGASIERFLPGYGWEHVLHLPPTSITSRIGRQLVELAVPELRLPAASYMLGLFLVVLTPDGQRRITDVRSWTHGNALTLEVEGETSRAAVRLPLTLEVRP